MNIWIWILIGAGYFLPMMVSVAFLYFWTFKTAYKKFEKVTCKEFLLFFSFGCFFPIFNFVYAIMSINEFVEYKKKQ
jgi:hypothetical protein